MDEYEKKVFTINDLCNRETTFYDLSVYTSNRNFRYYSCISSVVYIWVIFEATWNLQEYGLLVLFFYRLYMSSKMGRSDPLDICYHENQKELSTNKDIFLRSLILNVSKSIIVREFGNKDLGPPADITTLPVSYSGVTSNFLEFDELIASLIKPEGSIRNVKFYANDQTGFPVLIYNLKEFRFCGHINGVHRSNNVYFVANIRKRYMYQKCYKCVHYCGPLLRLMENGKYSNEQSTFCGTSNLTSSCSTVRSYNEESIFEDTSDDYECLLYAAAEYYENENDKSSDSDATTVKVVEKGIVSKDDVDICNCLELDAEVSLSEDVVKFVHLLHNKFDWIPPFIDQKCILDSSMVYDLETEPYLEVLRLQVCDERKVTLISISYH